MRISIVGTGYVGLVAGASLAAIGHHVNCVDSESSRVEVISKGSSPFFEPGLDEIVTTTVREGHLKATTDLSAAVLDSAVTFVAVATPDRDGRIDLSQIESAARAIGRVLALKDSYHVVAIKSTVVPGTTGGVVLRALEEASGKRVGVDFGLCMNPEFLREGSAVDDFMQPDRIVIGAYDKKSAEVFQKLYESFDCPKPIVSLDNAEFIKYASNAFLATVISFANEMAGLCEQTPGTDAEVVLAGVHLDKRLSPVIGGKRVRPGILDYLRPSSGYGGSCFPKDVTALRAFAEDSGLPTPLMNAVAEVNTRRSATVLRLAEERIGALAGRQVAVLGLTFKAGTDDLRHSPALELVHGLVERGARVSVHDPVATELARQILGDLVSYADDPIEAVSGAEVVVIGAGWPHWRELDWKTAAGVMAGEIVFDARNSIPDVPLPPPLFRVGIGAGPVTAD